MVHRLTRHAFERDGAVFLEFHQTHPISTEQPGQGVLEQDRFWQSQLAKGGAKLGAHPELFTKVVAHVIEGVGTRQDDVNGVANAQRFELVDPVLYALAIDVFDTDVVEPLD